MERIAIPINEMFQIIYWSELDIFFETLFPATLLNSTPKFILV